jgi:23S rRNA pseudouridine1911/1915/1917 synthase
VNILYEDTDLLVVDKPGNLVCHSASRPGQSSLAAQVREHGVATPRFLNRLDRETSGVIVVTKNERAAKILGKQMLRHEIEKEYVAICSGLFRQDTGTIPEPIAVTKDAPVYTKRVVDPAGKPCMTEFEVIRRLPDSVGAHCVRPAVGRCLEWGARSAPLQEFTVVRLTPRTGRAHQLRVHMAWLGHPVVGDKVYGPDERWYLEFIKKGVTDEMLRCLLMPRHALHAAAVTVRHPTSQEQVTWHAELPEDMKRFIEEHA